MFFVFIKKQFFSICNEFCMPDIVDMHVSGSSLFCVMARCSLSCHHEYLLFVIFMLLIASILCRASWNLCLSNYCRFFLPIFCLSPAVSSSCNATVHRVSRILISPVHTYRITLRVLYFNIETNPQLEEIWNFRSTTRLCKKILTAFIF